MPELAEIETVRRQCARHLQGLKILDVSLDVADRYFFAFVDPEAVKTALVGNKIVGVGRKGKYFWWKMARGPWPIFHLGMSGNVLFRGPGGHSGKQVWEGARLHSEGSTELESRLWFSRINVKFAGGVQCIIADPRRFGRMWLHEDPLQLSRIQKLGRDPHLDLPDPEELGHLLRPRKRALKTVLLDQSALSGIGNWLADEILYQARLSPHRRPADLSAREMRALQEALKMVVEEAVAVDAHYERFPSSWLFHLRWGKKKGQTTSHGHPIIHEEVGGRTTAWVPGWQK